MKLIICILFSFFLSLEFQAQTLENKISKLSENSNHKEAIIDLKSILTTSKISDSQKVLVHSALVFHYNMIQQFDSSLVIAKAQLLHSKKIKHSYGEASYYKLIGNIYYFLSNPDRAIHYYQRSIEKALPNKHYFEVEDCYHNIAAIRLEKGLRDSVTESLLLKAIDINIKLTNPRRDRYFGHYRILATMYENLGQLNKAKTIYKDLLIFARKHNMKYEEMTCLCFYSKVISGLGNYKEACDLSQRSIEMAIPYDDLDALSTTYVFHADNLRLAGLKDSAIKILLTLDELKRNRYQTNLSKSIAEAEAKFKNTEIEYEKNVAIADAKRRTQLYLFGSIGFVIITAFGFLFYNARKKSQLEKEQIKAILLAEENERSRIARDLHDGIGQLLSAAKLNLHALENVNLVNKEIILEKAIGLVDESAKEVRSVSHNLMPNALIKSGLVSAIKNFINQLQTDKLKINIETSGLNKKINSEIELVVYRIIQECINNVIKHAKANQLFINLSIEKNHLNIMIEDNGKGFEVDKILEEDGIGIKNMQSRVAYLKGTMEIDSKLDKGTLFAFHIPLNKENNA